STDNVPETPQESPPDEAEKLEEQHFTIRYGDTGYSYESIIGPYLKGAKAIIVEDPYIRMRHQMQNFVRLCEAVMQSGTTRKIKLITSYESTAQLQEMEERFAD